MRTSREERFRAAINELRQVPSNDSSREGLIRWTASLYEQPPAKVRWLVGRGRPHSYCDEVRTVRRILAVRS